jgi:S-adenosylmethionine uptake transporter
MRAGLPVLPLAVAALGIATYGVMDALMKELALGIGAYSALFWRLAVGLAVTAVAYLATRPVMPAREVMAIHAGRSVLVTAMALAFFWGIARVPLAEAVALSFIAPLIALGLAAVFLKEAVGWRSVAASVLGLAGVGVVMAGRLDGAHGPDTARGMIAVLVSAVIYAANLVVARAQAQRAGPVEIAFWQSLFVLGLLMLGAPVWLVAPAPGQWPAVGGAAALAVVSLLALSWAYARAEAKVLVSVEYTAFIWAAIMGWWMFGETLTAVTVAGTVLIVAGCVLAARAGGPATPDAEVSA